MRKRTAYQCDFCSKLLINHTQMKKHEPICFKNQASKSCATCKLLDISFNSESEIDGDFCKAFGRKLKKLQTNCPYYKSKEDSK